MDQLESLEGIACFGLLADNLEDGVDEFCSFRVEALDVLTLKHAVITICGANLRPVVSSTCFSCYEGIRAEERTDRTAANLGDC